MAFSIDALRAASYFGTKNIQLNRVTGQLEKDPRRSRLFCPDRQLQAGTRETAAHIRSRLCEHYGGVRGRRLFAGYLGNKVLSGKKLISSDMIRDVLKAGDAEENRYADMFIKTGMGELSERRGFSVSQIMDIAGVDRTQLHHVFAYSSSLLGVEAYGIWEIDATLEDIETALSKIQSLRRELQGRRAPESPALALDTDLKVLWESLETRRNALIIQREQHPSLVGNVKSAADLLCEAALDYLGGLETAELSQRKQKDIAVCIQKITAMKTALFAGLDVNASVSEKEIKQFAKLPGTLTALIRKEVGGRSKKIARGLKKCHTMQLGRRPWLPVVRDVSFYHKGLMHTVRSWITPAGSLNATFAALYNGGGFCCSDFRSPHAINLAQTRLSVEDPSVPSKEKVLFKAFRHGVLSAFGLSGKERLLANIERAKEVYAASISEKPELLKRALAGEAVPLPVVSAALLTPDLLRGYSATANERQYLKDQVNAWKHACDRDGICRLVVLDSGGVPREIRIRPQVMTFNFGVNMGAQWPGLGWLMGWGLNDRLNTAALKEFIGDLREEGVGGTAARYMKNLNGKDRENVLLLVRQIKELMLSGGHRDKKENPYRVPARIMLLASILGLTPAFNCKSGKDRTGQLDAEAKTLAVQLELGEVPPLRNSEDPDRQELFGQMSINCGNHEIQRMNTGLAGFKTGVVGGLDRDFSPSALEAHRGLSSFVRA